MCWLEQLVLLIMGHLHRRTEKNLFKDGLKVAKTRFVKKSYDCICNAPSLGKPLLLRLNQCFINVFGPQISCHEIY